MYADTNVSVSLTIMKGCFQPWRDAIRLGLNVTHSFTHPNRPCWDIRLLRRYFSSQGFWPPSTPSQLVVACQLSQFSTCLQGSAWGQALGWCRFRNSYLIRFLRIYWMVLVEPVSV